MNFQDVKPELVIKPEYLTEYTEQLDRFYYEHLVHLNTNIFILRKIFDFPFHVFASLPDDILFFRVVIENFISISVITITRLATDKANGLITLPQFKNRLITYIKSEYETELRSLLRSKRFDLRIRELLDKAKAIRDTSIAHIKRDSSSLEIAKISFDELRILCETLNDLFESLSFGSGHSMLPWAYIQPTNHSTHITDIDRVLDGFARQSAILNFPENHPARWRARYRSLSKQDISIINTYRRKFGMSEVQLSD